MAPSKNYKVAIDCGHGLKTAGKRTPPHPKTGKVIHEWEFNHPTAKALEKMLKEEGYEVIMLSDTEVDTPINDRVRKANSENVDVVISIHYNALAGVWGTHGGIETLHFPNSTNGIKLSKLVQDELIKATGLRDRGIKPRGDLGMLKTKAVAILIEGGFMDNIFESELMLNKTHQTNCARAIANGINKYFGYSTNISVTPPKKEEITMNKPTINNNTPSTWAKEAWSFVQKEGLLDGTRPRDTITREEIAIVLKRLADSGRIK